MHPQHNIPQHKMNPPKTKARFGRLLRLPAMETERAYSGRVDRSVRK